MPNKSLDGVLIAYVMEKQWRIHLNTFRAVEQWVAETDEQSYSHICTHIRTPLFLTPLEIMANDIASPPRIHGGLAYKPEVSGILWTCQCVPLKFFTLELKARNVDDLDENKQEYVVNKRACVRNKMELPGPALCLQ